MPTESSKSSSLDAALCAIIAVTLSAVAVWTAWDDGGGHFSTQWVGSLVVWCLIPLGALAAWRQRSYRAPTVVVLAITVWVLAAAQCLPLPPGMVKVLSPGSYEAYREWLPESIRIEALETPDSSAATFASHAIPISVSPTFTRMALSLPLLFAAGVWMSSLAFASRRAAIAMLVIPAVVGGLFAFFGLADMIRLARDSDYDLRQRLLITPVGADGPFGPFINNNTCAGYLNLTIGCALGLLLGMRYRAMEDARRGILRHWQSIACILLIVVMVAGILGSGSRGGFLGLATATIVLTLLGTRGWSRIGLMVALVVIALSSLMFLDELGIRDRTVDRLETLYDGTASNDPRLKTWHDGLIAATSHLPAGAGYGAFRYAILPHQVRGGGGWAVNADGMHVEWLLEGGVWLIPILGVIVVLIIRAIRGVNGQISSLPLREARVGRALAVASTFSLSSLFATQSFDFGINHIPLLLTFAVLVGGLIRFRRLAQADSVRHVGRWGTRVSVICCLLIVVGLGSATWALYSGGVWQTILIQRYNERRIPINEREGLDEKIEQLKSLVAAHPNDAMAHQALARLLLDRQHQIGAVALLQQESISRADASRWASPRNVRIAFYESELDFEELMLEGQDPDDWRLARQHAVASLVLSPLDDTTRVLLIETDFVDEGRDEATAELLEQTALLRPRTARILSYLESHAAVHPGGEPLERIQSLRRGYQRKRQAAVQ